jgi:hypothetical protein
MIQPSRAITITNSTITGNISVIASVVLLATALDAAPSVSPTEVAILLYIITPYFSFFNIPSTIVKRVTTIANSTIIGTNSVTLSDKLLAAAFDTAPMVVPTLNEILL